ncbi:MAG: hypothetical protein J6K77_03545 [Ruminococcus sp.]|nr:hypothetical protein [Ruminococcus sp.]
MLEIQESFDTSGYEQIIAGAGANNVHITEAVNGDEKLGYIAYAYEADRTVVYGYDDGGDLMLCDGLVRSVMFKSVLKGIETMVFEIPDESRYESLRKLRFLGLDTNVCGDLNSFMNGCENCKNKSEKGDV